MRAPDRFERVERFLPIGVGKESPGMAQGTVQFVDFRGPSGPFHGGGFPSQRPGPRPGVIDVTGEEIVEPSVPPSLPR